MLHVLKINKPIEVKPTTSTFVCITLRQWAILFSILIFILMAIITTGTVLGSLHKKQILHLLEDHIEEERDKHLSESDDNHMSRNEIVLQRSEGNELSSSKIFSICMWLAWVNLVLAAVLVYGVATMTSIYIIPWLLISGITFLLAITTAIMGYLDLIPGVYISYPVMLVCLAASMVFIEMWYTIVLYYLSLGRNGCASRFGSLSPTIIHAYGGYTHTIKPMRSDPNKPLV
ncbi:hypothetical protein Zmor_023973 [Zophobas morio]|uniref:Uncharacterized protein n=1 Tax=Zophobas morio TaxID=2755281 RepID=A0AA38HZF4_9CUCU|nr:hypothetical protein Zmor_023973 [Zophobas morio]